MTDRYWIIASATPFGDDGWLPMMQVVKNGRVVASNAAEFWQRQAPAQLHAIAMANLYAQILRQEEPAAAVTVFDSEKEREEARPIPQWLLRQAPVKSDEPRAICHDVNQH
jgi:hypothetical protein